MSRPRLRRARAAALGVLAALACGELGLRVLGYTPHFVNPIASFHVPDAEIGLRGRPDFAGRFAQTEFDVRVELDGDGFRKVEASRDAADDRPRLFVLGDSFTWGWGVDQGECFVDRLAAASPGVEVRNLGLSGTGTVVAHRLFERHALPDLGSGDAVLLVTFENDLADNLGRNHDRWLHATVADGQVVEVPAPDQGSSGRVKAWFKQHSCLFNLAAFVADRFKLARRQNRAAADVQKEAAPVEPDEVLVYRHYLARIRDEARNRGASFGVACIPPRALYDGDAEATQPVRDRHTAMLDGPRELGIPTLDLLPAFVGAQASGTEPWTFPFDGHWTEAGHRLAADTMTPFVRGILPDTAGSADSVRRR